MTFRDQPIRVCLIVITVLVLGCGLGLVGVSYLPFHVVRAKIDTLTYDRSADPFSEQVFEQIAVRLRFMGIVLIPLAGWVYLAWRRIERNLSTGLGSLVFFCKEVLRRLVQATRDEDKSHIFVFSVIMIMAIGLRLIFLGRPMGYDEAWTFEAYASKPLVVGLSYYSGPNNHLFHTFLVHMAYIILGNKPWVIRLPAFVSGTLLVPASYMLARLFYNKHAAILTAALVTSSTPLVLYSTDARGYSLLSMLFLLILAVAAYIKEHDSPACWILFTIFSALGFYTIPIFVYPFGIVVTWLFLSISFEKGFLVARQRFKKLLLSLIGVSLLTIVLYSPVFVISGVDAVLSNRFVASQSWQIFLSELPNFALSVWREWNQHIPWIVRVCTLVGFSVAMVFHRRITRYRIPVIAAVIAWLGLVLIAHPVVRFTRVWTFLLPIYLMVAASGLSLLFQIHTKKVGRIASVMAMALAIFLSTWTGLNLTSSRTSYWKMKWAPADAEPITIFLRNYLKPGDAVVSRSHLDPPLAYYFHVHRVPLKYLGANPSSSSRILVIIYKKSRQKPEDVLRRVEAPMEELTLPTVVKEFESFAIYETDRIHKQEAGLTEY